MPKIAYERIGEYVRTALQIVSDNGGALRSREVFREAGQRLVFDDYETERFEKTGYVRWTSFLSFYSIYAVKAGWIVKNAGIWHITPEGESALELSDINFYEGLASKYREWKQNQLPDSPSDEPEGIDEPEEGDVSRQLTYEQAENTAVAEIESFIRNCGPYKFQALVAVLLRGMGYFTPFITPKGRDGGVDILAYSDPLGTVAPRIVVQVKHRQQKATVQEIRELSGLLQRDGDTGLFVSSGGFTTEAEREVKGSRQHIENMDLEKFIGFWKDHYGSMKEEDKALLPLRNIMFLAPTQSS